MARPTGDRCVWHHGRLSRRTNVRTGETAPSARFGRGSGSRTLPWKCSIGWARSVFRETEARSQRRLIVGDWSSGGCEIVSSPQPGQPSRALACTRDIFFESPRWMSACHPMHCGQKTRRKRTGIRTCSVWAPSVPATADGVLASGASSAMRPSEILVFVMKCVSSRLTFSAKARGRMIISRRRHERALTLFGVLGSTSMCSSFANAGIAGSLLPSFAAMFTRVTHSLPSIARPSSRAISWIFVLIFFSKNGVRRR
jgi:hypothetical protein